MEESKTWLISDIHGELGLFDRLLTGVNLGKDRLIILGDVIDRGEHSMELMDKVRELMKQYPDKVQMIKGNHELFLEMYVDGTLSEQTWLSKDFGGKPTLGALKKMSPDEKDDLVRFIRELPLYMEIDSPFFGKTVLTHSGLYADEIVRNEDGTINVIRSIEAGYANDPFEFMCSNDIHFMPSSYVGTGGMDRFVIVGHTPCVYLDGNSYKIVRKKRYMCIDSGVAHPDLGGRLAMYCVETDEEVYA